MIAVERFTKQNHDLEEQLRQRDAGHNVQEDNQEDSSERDSILYIWYAKSN